MGKLMFVIVLLASSMVFGAEPSAPATPLKPAAASAPVTAPTGPVAPMPEVTVNAPVPKVSLEVGKPSKVTTSTDNGNGATADTDPTPAEVIKEIAALVEASKGLKNKSLPGILAVTVFLGALFKLLLSLLKVLGKNFVWFKTQDGKRVIKYSTLALGAAAGLCANLGFGMNWIEALILMLSGPISVAIHEYTSDSKPAPAP